MRYAGILSFYQNSGIDYSEQGVQISAFNTFMPFLCVWILVSEGARRVSGRNKGCCSVMNLLWTEDLKPCLE